MKIENIQKVVYNQSLGAHITKLQFTIAKGQTKGANEKSSVFIHEHGGYDIPFSSPGAAIHLASAMDRDLARSLDPWRWPNGSQPLGTRM